MPMLLYKRQFYWMVGSHTTLEETRATLAILTKPREILQSST